MTTTVHHQVEVIIVEEEVGEAEDEVVGVEEEVDSHPQKEIGPALIPRECFLIYYTVFYSYYPYLVPKYHSISTHLSSLKHKDRIFAGVEM